MFRGLPHSGRSLQPLQDAIRAAPGKEMLPEFAEMKERLKREFMHKNAAARDEKSQKETGMTWEQAQKEAERKIVQDYNEKMQNQAAAGEARWKTLDAERQAAENAERFLKEAFPPDGPKKAVIVLKTLDEFSRQSIHVNAEELGLHTESTDTARMVGSSGSSNKKRWIVIARKTGLVSAKIQEIEREALQAYQKWEKSQAAEISDGGVVAQQRSGAGGWDVTGNWCIRCPNIEENYDGDELWLDLYLGKVNGQVQMYAQFDFRILTGFWRFESLGAGALGKAKEKAKANAKTAVRSGWGEDYEYGYDEGDEDEEEEEEEEEENEDFYLGKDDQPSEQCPKWNFRWRGRETAEGVIELYSDKELCSVTFSGPGGCKMSGVLRNDFVSDCTFTGVKVDTKAEGRQV